MIFAKSNFDIVHILNNRLGADYLINYHENPSYQTDIMIITKLEGVDLIFDPILASNFNYVRFAHCVVVNFIRTLSLWVWIADGLSMEQWVEQRSPNAVSLRY